MINKEKQWGSYFMKNTLFIKNPSREFYNRVETISQQTVFNCYWDVLRLGRWENKIGRFGGSEYGLSAYNGATLTPESSITDNMIRLALELPIVEEAKKAPAIIPFKREFIKWGVRFNGEVEGPFNTRAEARNFKYNNENNGKVIKLKATLEEIV